MLVPGANEPSVVQIRKSLHAHIAEDSDPPPTHPPDKQWAKSLLLLLKVFAQEELYLYRDSPFKQAVLQNIQEDCSSEDK